MSVHLTHQFDDLLSTEGQVIASAHVENNFEAFTFFGFCAICSAIEPHIDLQILD